MKPICLVRIPSLPVSTSVPHPLIQARLLLGELNRRLKLGLLPRKQSRSTLPSQPIRPLLGLAIARVQLSLHRIALGQPEGLVHLLLRTPRTPELRAAHIPSLLSQRRPAVRPPAQFPTPTRLPTTRLASLLLKHAQIAPLASEPPLRVVRTWEQILLERVLLHRLRATQPRLSTRRRILPCSPSPSLGPTTGPNPAGPRATFVRAVYLERPRLYILPLKHRCVVVRILQELVFRPTAPRQPLRTALPLAPPLIRIVRHRLRTPCANSLSRADLSA